jgi:hypothetical protein
VRFATVGGSVSYVTKRLVTTVPSSPTSPGALVEIDAVAIIPE